MKTFINLKVIATCKNYFIGLDEEDTTYKINRESIVSDIKTYGTYNFYLEESELEILNKQSEKILLELEEENRPLIIYRRDKELFLSTKTNIGTVIESFSKKDFDSLDLNENSKSLYLAIKTLLRVKKLRAD